MDDDGARKAMRIQLGVMLGAVVRWQALGAVFAWAAVPAIGTLLLELGPELPPFTRFVLATHRGWGIAPVLTTFIAIDVLRRPRASMAYATTVLVAGALIALVFQAGLLYAGFEPFIGSLGKVGQIR